MRSMKSSTLLFVLVSSLLFIQCGSSRKTKKVSTAPAPKTEQVSPANPASPATTDNTPAPKYDVEAKSQPENIPAPQVTRELAPMEEGPIQTGSETIGQPTKEQEEAMRKKVEKAVEKKKKG